jgi:hypothetical protein
MSDFFRPDEFSRINVEGSSQFFTVNAKYDRMDYFPRIGAWILKVFDDEHGLVSCYLDEKTARKVVAHTELPIVERDFMFVSEHEGYLTAQAKMLDEDWLD